MPRIRILKDTVANASPVFIGDVIEVTQSVYKQLEYTKKAELYVEEKHEEIKHEEPVQEVKEVVPEVQAKKTRKKSTKTNRKKEPKINKEEE